MEAISGILMIEIYKAKLVGINTCTQSHGCYGLILYRTPCKLTASLHLEMDGWKMNGFVFGMAQPSRCFCC